MMLQIKYYTVLLFTFILSLIVIQTSYADGNYPKPREERRMDEMGSILQGEGMTFRPNKVRNDSTETITLENKSTKHLSKEAGLVQVNSYLWHAALEILHFAPLITTDSHSGIIITEWYTPKESRDASFKIQVLIKDNIINPEALEVRVFRKKLNQETIIEEKKPVLALKLEEKILRRARELYIRNHPEPSKNR